MGTVNVSEENKGQIGIPKVLIVVGNTLAYFEKEGIDNLNKSLEGRIRKDNVDLEEIFKVDFSN